MKTDPCLTVLLITALSSLAAGQGGSRGWAWNETAKFNASDGANEDELGHSVSIQGDTALIGAPHDDDWGVSNSGSAYVFVRNGTSWTEQTKSTS